MSTLAFTRVYAPGARSAHLLDENASPNGPWPAMCGTESRIGLWHGTGNWDEMQRAQELPLCPRCANRAGVSP